MEKLTKREMTVIELMIQGHDNNTIAKILHISTHTVKIHVNSILRKTFTKNRYGAVYVIALKMIRDNYLSLDKIVHNLFPAE